MAGNSDPLLRHIFGQMLSSTKPARRLGATHFKGSFGNHAGRLSIAAIFTVLASSAVAGLLFGHAQSPQGQPTAVVTGSNTSTQTPNQAQQDLQRTGSAPADQSKLEVASQCAELLKLATDLKTEVDKSTKDTLSVTVVRKAGQIEQLAHKVRTGTGKS